MKKINLFYLFSLVTIFAFASFPVETQTLLIEADSDKFKLDTWGFIIGILTFMFIPILYGWPLLLLLIRKKNFRGSLAWGWLAGLILTVLIILLVALNPQSILLY